MRLKPSTWTMLGICLGMLLLNLLARCSTAFSDWYMIHLFPLFSGLWSRLSGLFPFSVGEILIILGVLAIVLVPLSFVILLLMFKHHRRKIALIYSKTLGWFLTWLLSVETLHFFLLYHCTPFGDRYFPHAQDTYSREEVLEVYQTVILEANAAAEEVARDEAGYFMMTDDLQTVAKLAMQKLAETYPQFEGYYPDAKPIMNSYIMTQQYILGIYYPFTMESNYNADVYPINLPNTICHEFSHLKGYMSEDEAGFLAFLACQGSDSADFRYSGYINALEYLMDAGYEADTDGSVTALISSKVRQDLYCYVPEDYWEEHEEEELISTEIMHEVASTAIDTSLKLNGVEDGEKSYSRMVNLLLDYYLYHD